MSSWRLTVIGYAARVDVTSWHRFVISGPDQHFYSSEPIGSRIGVW